jgi:cytochrome c5
MQNKYSRWFSRVVWLGIVCNLLFVAAQFFAPNMVNVGMDMPVTTSTVWNVAHGTMVLALSLLYIPAALNPLQYPLYSWLIVASRFVAAILWAWVVSSNPGFTGALIMDGCFGIAEAILLQLAMPQDAKISGTNIGSACKRMGAGIRTGLASPAVRVVLGVLVALAAVVGYELWYNLMRAEPDIQYSSIEDQYKYGAIGLGSDSRVPYWIWKVLPDMFPEKLPGAGGWSSLGFILEPGHDLPIGFAHRKIGYDSVEANCSLCHTAQFRRTPTSKEEVVLGAPAHTLDLQSFQRFLYSAAADPRFTPDNVIAAINRVHPLGFTESIMYRYLIIPATKEGLLEQKLAYSWQDSRPQQGRGRTDTFNPTKFNVFHMAEDNTIGTVDLPQVWNQKPRETMYLHWDGNNNNIHERNFAAAMAIGATPKTVILPSFNRVTNFLWTLQPAAYPFPIDHAAAERGKSVFDQQCAGCHAFGAKSTGQVEDIAQIGTDRHRLDSFSAALVDKFHSIDNPPFKFDAYRKTNGYANVPLDGIWVRAPYLHNGSVPNLQAMLETPQNRPVVFYRGYDVYDPEHVGFVSEGPEAAKVGFLVDTNIPGNGNQGHLYGTDLAAAQKHDLIEYLKTL